MRNVEVDVDGVLADIDEGLTFHLSKIYKGFNAREHIKSWGMKELDDLDVRLRPRALELFKDPSFIESLKPFDGCIEAFKDLSKFLTRFDSKVIVNTNLVSEPCAFARMRWIKKYLMFPGINTEYNVAWGKEKKMTDSLVVIEDHLDNLRNSPAPVKFLVKRGSNRDAKASDLGVFEECYIVDSFVDAVDIIKENMGIWLEKYRIGVKKAM